MVPGLRLHQCVHPVPEVTEGEATAKTVLLSVIVPVYNQADAIAQNVRVIAERVALGLPGDFEIIVVSDGSVDDTGELLVESELASVRVIHYDRNLGKGYAVKIGALEAEGEWIGFVDADLDLDPAALATYVQHGREHRLDFVIGSKRHPDSQVHYPRSRVVASWCFQQLVRLLFRLDVRDTQVGLKVFRREVAEQVLPLLLVKRFAFDIELLAVSRAVGFGRIEEMPVRLDYRFTGSGVRSRAVLRALIDTAAIFYRLRVLRYYQRRRAIVGPYGWTRPRVNLPSVSVLVLPGASFREADYPGVEILDAPGTSLKTIRQAAEHAQGEVFAVLEPGGRAPGNWLAAAVPFFVRDEIVAVVSPKMAPLSGSVWSRAAAAVDESRIGAGLGYFRYTPGNVRYVDDFPAGSFVVRRALFTELPDSLPADELVSELATLGRVLYTPEAVVVVEPKPLFRLHLAAVVARGRRRGAAVRRGKLLQGGYRSAWQARSLVVIPVFVVAVATLAIELGGARTDIVVAACLVYLAAVAIGAIGATLRFQSVAVGGLTALGIVTTHLAYLSGYAAGIAAP